MVFVAGDGISFGKSSFADCLGLKAIFLNGTQYSFADDGNTVFSNSSKVKLFIDKDLKLPDPLKHDMVYEFLRK